MEVLKRVINPKTKEGTIEFKITTQEGLWHLYNIVDVGDRIISSTQRKVVDELNTGTTVTRTVHLNLKIKVKKVDYNGNDQCVRISGQTDASNGSVKAGAHHTSEIGVHETIIVEKDEWDSLHLQRVRDATDFKSSAEVAVLLIDSGVANLYLTSQYLSRLVAQVNMTIPKRRQIGNDRDNAMQKFFNAVTQLVVQHVLSTIPDLNPQLRVSSSEGGVKSLVIAGPGFVWQDYLVYLKDQQKNSGAPAALQKIHPEFFVGTKASTVLRNALDELISNPEIQNKVLAGRAAQQQKVFSEFYRMLLDHPGKVCYGLRHVQFAIQQGAVRKLLITERLFKHDLPEERKKFIKLVDEVKLSGGEVLVCADQHVSGEQLNGLGGCACFLHFELEQLDEMSDDEFDPMGEDIEDGIDTLGELTYKEDGLGFEEFTL